MSAGDEAARIAREYERRERELPADFYSIGKPDVLFRYQERVRATLAALNRAGKFPLTDVCICEVGCGGGDWLSDFVNWGAASERIAGIELSAARAATARARVRGADIRVGDASQLPWPDASFDLVLQSTVFTSILDTGMKQAVAREMARVLAPGGVILWYDFRFDNPRNPNVRGVKAREIRGLFPGFAVALERITLAPPLARRLVPLTWLGSLVLEKLRVLNTHYLGVLRRP